MKNKIRQIQESEKIYHGCLNKNKDGSNRLFEKGDQCCIPINCPFWKQLWDVPNGVKTRSQEKEHKKVKIEDFNRYFQNIVNVQRWLEASDSEIEILNETDEFYIVNR